MKGSEYLWFLEWGVEFPEPRTPSSSRCVANESDTSGFSRRKSETCTEMTLTRSRITLTSFSRLLTRRRASGWRNWGCSVASCVKTRPTNNTSWWGTTLRSTFRPGATRSRLEATCVEDEGWWRGFLKRQLTMRICMLEGRAIVNTFTIISQTWSNARRDSTLRYVKQEMQDKAKVNRALNAIYFLCSWAALHGSSFQLAWCSATSCSLRKMRDVICANLWRHNRCARDDSSWQNLWLAMTRARGNGTRNTLNSLWRLLRPPGTTSSGLRASRHSSLGENILDTLARSCLCSQIRPKPHIMQFRIVGATFRTLLILLPVRTSITLYIRYRSKIHQYKYCTCNSCWIHVHIMFIR